jgi:hypothetical protein
MLKLICWSSALALKPWALGLAWNLISGVAGLIGHAAPTKVTSSKKHHIDFEQTAAWKLRQLEEVPWSRLG